MPHFFRVTLVLVTCVSPGVAQSVGNCAPKVVVGSTTTDAGDGGPAVKAQFYNPTGLATDKAGNIYVADTGNNKMRVVAIDGTVRTLAGTGVQGSTGDGGSGIHAQLNQPMAVVVGPDGAIYIADTGGNRIRKVISDGTIHAVAGNGQGGFGGDGGPATEARMSGPSGLAFDTQGNLYIADAYNYRVRRVGKDGTISTVAGNGYTIGSINDDGLQAIQAYIGYPVELAAGPDGTLYIAGYDQVESVTPDGVMHIVAGGFSQQPAEGVPAVQAMLSIEGMALDPQGNLLVANGPMLGGTVAVVWRIGPDGILHNAMSTYSGEGLLAAPDGTMIRFGPAFTVIAYTPGPLSGGISPHVTLAGTSPFHDSGDGGPGTSAGLQQPVGLAADPAGNLFIADYLAGKIRKLDTKGIITTIAGTGGTAPTPDGLPALETAVYGPTAIAVASSGEIYYSDDGYRIRQIGLDGKVTTVAGNGSQPEGFYQGDPRDGEKATSAEIFGNALAIGGDGSLFISDPWSGVLWRVTTDGILHSIPAIGYFLRYPPRILATDTAGAIYFLDGNDGETLFVMRIVPGKDPQQFRDISNFFGGPYGFAIDAAGNLYLAEERMLSKSAPDGTVSELTNTTTLGPSVDFLSLALDRAGNLFAADGLARVQEVPMATTCTASVFPRINRQGTVNAASYFAGSATPGEIVSIAGIAVGPSEPAFSKVDSTGRLTTMIGNTQVLFDGIPAPMLYASSGQTATIVPFGVSVQATTDVQLSVNGFLSNVVPMSISDVQPGIFTRNASGSGQASALNQDYSVNSALHPAKKGSVVILYATGLGLVNPPVPDGTITGQAISRQVNQEFTVIMNDGGSAEVLYAGTAPGLVAGVSQMNIRISADTPSGDVRMQIIQGPSHGSGVSQANVTIAVE